MLLYLILLYLCCGLFLTYAFMAGAGRSGLVGWLHRLMRVAMPKAIAFVCTYRHMHSLLPLPPPPPLASSSPSPWERGGAGC